MHIKPIEAESFEVMVDNNRPSIIGLKVNPISGESFILPMDRSTATTVASLLIMVR
jgi:hypothetical protein